MKFHRKELERGIILLVVDGSILGGRDAISLNDEIQKLVAEGGRKFVVDMKAVDHINSSGLGILINSVNTARQAGGDLKIANASVRVLDLLRITKLNQIFVPYNSVEEAVKDLT